MTATSSASTISDSTRTVERPVRASRAPKPAPAARALIGGAGAAARAAWRWR